MERRLSDAMKTSSATDTCSGARIESDGSTVAGYPVHPADRDREYLSRCLCRYVQENYSIYSRETNSSDRFEIGIEMYGTQEVRIRTSRIPVSAASTNSDLKILKASYAAPFRTLTVSGKDIQGERGKLIVKFADDYDLYPQFSQNIEKMQICCSGKVLIN